jgi:hypothetical protein
VRQTTADAISVITAVAIAWWARKQEFDRRIFIGRAYLEAEAACECASEAFESAADWLKRKRNELSYFA